MNITGANITGAYTMGFGGAGMEVWNPRQAQTHGYLVSDKLEIAPQGIGCIQSGSAVISR